MVIAYHEDLGEIIFHEKLEYSYDGNKGYVHKVSKGTDLIFIFDQKISITKAIAIPEKTNEVVFVNTNNQIEKAIRKNTITFKKIKEIIIEPKFKSLFSVEKLKGVKI